jgi:Transposase DDE domain group 1
MPCKATPQWGKPLRTAHFGRACKHCASSASRSGRLAEPHACGCIVTRKSWRWRFCMLMAELPTVVAHVRWWPVSTAGTSPRTPARCCWDRSTGASGWCVASPIASSIGATPAMSSIRSRRWWDSYLRPGIGLRRPQQSRRAAQGPDVCGAGGQVESGAVDRLRGVSRQEHAQSPGAHTATAKEGRFFHGYYKEYCYLPLYVFCGRHLLLARQRRANVAGSDGAVEEIACAGSFAAAFSRRMRPRLRMSGDDADAAVPVTIVRARAYN